MNISSELRMRGFITEQEVGDILGVVQATLKLWRVKGSGPRYFKIGGRILYRRDDLDAFIERQARRSTSQAA